MLAEGKSAQEIEIYRVNFEREASLLAQLNHPGHSNIPEIHDYFSDATGNYLVMKYIEGQSLKEVLGDDSGKIPWREAVRYMVAVCSALTYMHTHSAEPVIHRDIKPANILLGNDGRVWLVDFGLARAKPIESTGDLQATQAAGSLGYSPLEQWLGEAVPASDVYAVGATLHHLVTGLHPMKAFGGEYDLSKLIKMHGQFVLIRQVDKSLPKNLEEIIVSATVVKPDQRLTPPQLQQQLEALISGAQAAALFIFKSGASAKTVRELVDLCETNRQEAQEYLYNGDFERWFLMINRNDLAEAAAQAVNRGKNEAAGLEQFLKLMMPNLWRKRLGRTSGQIARMALQFGLILLGVILLIVIGGSYGVGWFIQRSISNYAWNFDELHLDEPNRFTETMINENVQQATASYLEDIRVDMRSPNLVEVKASWSGIEFDLPLTLHLENGKPHFRLTEINQLPLLVITDNISQGINNGIDHAFQKAPVDIADLQMSDSEVIFTVTPSGRVPLPTPTPTVTLTPTTTPTPTATPTPLGVATLAVFNYVDQALILSIEGLGEWEIEAGDSKVIELEPGTYNYMVIYRDTGEIVAQGVKTWTVKTYKWRIGLDEE